eukprot:6474468-Amphidinium_carterae.2
MSKTVYTNVLGAIPFLWASSGAPRSPPLTQVETTTYQLLRPFGVPPLCTMHSNNYECRPKLDMPSSRSPPHDDYV